MFQQLMSKFFLTPYKLLYNSLHMSLRTVYATGKMEITPLHCYKKLDICFLTTFTSQWSIFQHITSKTVRLLLAARRLNCVTYMYYPHIIKGVKRIWKSQDPIMHRESLTEENTRISFPAHFINRVIDIKDNQQAFSRQLNFDESIS